MIDLHCHILPGFDDGPADLAGSVAMARVASADGVRRIAATPHVFRAAFPAVDPAAIGPARDRLEEALRAEGVDVEVRPGAEVHLSHDLVENLRRERARLTLAGGSYFFLEFPSDHVFPDVKRLVFELTSEGLTPIVAHPERNRSFARRPRLLFELEEMGVLAQVNAGSLLGAYGPEAKDAAVRFLECRLVQVLASDGHDAVRRPPTLSGAVKAAAAAAGEEAARALVEANPLAILEDREDLPYRPDPVDPDARAGRGFRWPRLKGRRR